MSRKSCPTCKTSYPSQLQICPEDGSRLEAGDDGTSGWSAGKIVAHKYVIFAETDSSEVASTYRVRSLDADEVGSLQVLNPPFGSDRAAVRDFRGTARLLLRVEHPNVIAAQSTGDTEGGTPFMVTEVVHGRRLDELIRGEGPLELRSVCSIAGQIAAGLSAAHRQGLLHLGLNPAAVFVSGTPGNEKVKVADFGAGYVRLTRTRNESRRSSLTLRDLLPANLWYCAPEQALGWHPEELDARADLYSLGVVIFQMLTASIPDSRTVSAGVSDTRSQLESLAARLEDGETPFRTEGIDIPEPAKALLTQLLQPRPQLRPPTAQHVVEKIRMVEDGIASRALMGLRAGPGAPSENFLGETNDETAAAGEMSESETQEQVPSGRASVESVEVESEALLPVAISAPESSRSPEVELPARRPSTTTPYEPRYWGGTLFKAPPARPREWERWAMAAAVLVIVAAGAFLLVTHRLSPGPGPLSPAKPDELQSTDAAAPPSDAHSLSSKQQGSTPPQTGGTTAQVATPPVTPDQGAGATKPSSAGSGAGGPPAPGLAPESPDVKADVDQAVTAGDVFFEQGRYELAIQTYAGPLKADPGNKQLRARIARARKAQAAEQRYLGEQ